MNLRTLFSDVMHKELVAVDLPGRISNQHELNGIAAFKRFFGTQTESRGPLSWHYFADDAEPVQEDGTFTFYDPRARSAARTGRSEWRFYYQGNFLSRASVGDWFVLARASAGGLFGLVFQKDSGWCRAARELFGATESCARFELISPESLGGRKLEWFRRQIIAELGLPIEIPAVESDEALMLERFGRGFPTTKAMSEFARQNAVPDSTDIDSILLGWLDREEQLFRALESVLIRERLHQGFATVDAFIEYSLSVQNRRKSRMGHALQNHLAEIFSRQGLRFTSQARTEAKNRPDFIFPGEREYRDPSFSADLLIMLGVKSSSKDRWRQILTEADRISEKHLCTLEAGISVTQTDEMYRQRLRLVVPAGLLSTYTCEQRRHILCIAEFVDVVRHTQSR